MRAIELGLLEPRRAPCSASRIHRPGAAGGGKRERFSAVCGHDHAASPCRRAMIPAAMSASVGGGFAAATWGVGVAATSSRSQRSTCFRASAPRRMASVRVRGSVAALASCWATIRPTRHRSACRSSMPAARPVGRHDAAQQCSTSVALEPPAANAGRCAPACSGRSSSARRFLCLQPCALICYLRVCPAIRFVF